MLEAGWKRMSECDLLLCCSGRTTIEGSRVTDVVGHSTHPQGVELSFLNLDFE